VIERAGTGALSAIQERPWGDTKLDELRERNGDTAALRIMKALQSNDVQKDLNY
jgi:hypothetical protein